METHVRQVRAEKARQSIQRTYKHEKNNYPRRGEGERMIGEIIATCINVGFGIYIGYRLGRTEAIVEAHWAILKKALSEEPVNQKKE